MNILPSHSPPTSHAMMGSQLLIDEYLLLLFSIRPVDLSFIRVDWKGGMFSGGIGQLIYSSPSCSSIFRTPRETAAQPQFDHHIFP